MLVIDLVTAVSVLRQGKQAAAMKELIKKKKKEGTQKSKKARMFLKIWHGGMLCYF